MDAPLWPLGVKLTGSQSEDAGVINISPGITTLVGPNGSGKTRALRAIQGTLKFSGIFSGRKVRFLAAGRSSPFEHFRADVGGPGHRNTSDAAVGDIGLRDQWWDIESLTGDILALDLRPDLKLKVEARLQQLFDRSLELRWTQAGLSLRITGTKAGGSYPANYEASGILQLVALLSAIHNDQIGALLIDEPEISLHPQHQAFLLNEMERVAGDPAEAGKKIIVIATHSTSLLPLRSVDSLPKIAFFESPAKPPAQMRADEGALKRDKMKALIARLNATHRAAMFADRILLVEGPSDETIASLLADRTGAHLSARNAQILPVTGKGEFPEVARLFSLMNKRVGVLADLDALADDNRLVNYFSSQPGADQVAAKASQSSLADLDRQLRNALATFMRDNATAIEQAATAYPDWSDDAPADLRLRRVTLARLLSDPESFGSAVEPAKLLSTRYAALLAALAEVGCFFLRLGAIENYYGTDATTAAKPARAALEAATFPDRDEKGLTDSYGDVFAALSFIAPDQGVDEDLLLRPKLGAMIGALFLSMANDTSDVQLNTIARTTIGPDAGVFRVQNRSTNGKLRLWIDINSPLFARRAFPFEIDSDQNVNTVVPQVLPGRRT